MVEQPVCIRVRVEEKQRRLEGGHLSLAESCAPGAAATAASNERLSSSRNRVLYRFGCRVWPNQLGRAPRHTDMGILGAVKSQERLEDASLLLHSFIV